MKNNILNNEIWKDIPEYEKFYQASNLGRVKSLDRIMWVEKRKRYLPLKGQILSPKTDKYGYLCIVLCRDGKHKHITVHRVIAKTFIPNFNNYSEINHINCDKQDNRIENLEWCTTQQNGFHKWKIKGIKCLEEPIYDMFLSEFSAKKLNIDTVRKIRRLYNQGKYTQQEVGDMFNISACHVSDIVNNKKWDFNN